MTAIKIKHEDKILDLTQKISKSNLKKTLKSIKLKVKDKNYLTHTIFFTKIKTGIFDIQLDIYDFLNYGINKDISLEDVPQFRVSIWECNSNFPLNLYNEPLFQSQPWINSNDKSELCIDHLIDIIMLCKRVNNIKVFS